jgi:hypothetical protein
MFEKEKKDEVIDLLLDQMAIKDELVNLTRRQPRISKVVP